MIDDKIITQLSIFVNNEPGRLATINRIIKDTGVKVLRSTWRNPPNSVSSER